MNYLTTHWILLARVSLTIVYVWFGLLKVINQSPAHDLVVSLAKQTIPFVNPETFTIVFGGLEIALGLAILFRAWDRVVVPLILLHLLLTMGPLVFLPGEAWTRFGVLTLVGQYIVKNVVLATLAIAILAEDHRGN